MTKYNSFQEFYTYYLSQNQNLMCRRLHFAGCVLALLCLLAFLFSFKIHFIILGIILGYACSWIGNYVFEKNKPTTFEYPLYSFMGNWMMFVDMLTQKIKIW